MSYSARPEPIGVELRFEDGAVAIDVVDLPEGQGETRTERAIRAMQDYLETHRGTVVPHQVLMDIAVEEANLRRRASIDAIGLLKERYGDELVTAFLPGRGKPQGYRLKLEPDTPSLCIAPLHQIGDKASDTANHLVHTPSTHNAPNQDHEPNGDSDETN